MQEDSKIADSRTKEALPEARTAEEEVSCKTMQLRAQAGP
jgi:hypothetical protein